MLKKIISLFIILIFGFETAGFAQFSTGVSKIIPDTFRPIHLRSLEFNSIENNFKLLVDKGSIENSSKQLIEETSKELLKYFLIGVSLPNDAFWVNLRPDASNEIIDENLAKTDVGKVLLEADLQLKKDLAAMTSPNNSTGKIYWDKIYKKVEILFGNKLTTIPTLTRPWIVPDEIIISESQNSAYVYKATLKVMLEQDCLKDSKNYSFKDDKLKELNEFFSQLVREMFIPKLTQEINSAKRYASLRQVYYSLILAQWFKKIYGNNTMDPRFRGDDNISTKVDSKDLIGLTSKQSWSKETFFQAYQQSFKNGEYNFQASVLTSSGQVIRRYFSGGIIGLAPVVIPKAGDATLIDKVTGAKITVLKSVSDIIAKVQGPYLVAVDVLKVGSEARVENWIAQVVNQRVVSEDGGNDRLAELGKLYPAEIQNKLPDNDMYWKEKALDFEKNKANDPQPIWFFKMMLDGVDKKKRVLELATGSGRGLIEIMNMMNMGYDNVLGIDISQEALDEAVRKGVPKDKLINLNVKTEWISGKYSAVLASDLFLYFTPEELHDVMININNILDDNGRLAIRWAAEDENKIFVKDNGGARWVMHASEAFFRQMLPLFGFELKDIQKKKEPIYGGNAFVDYYYVIAEKKQHIVEPFLMGQLSKVLNVKLNQIVQRRHSHIFSVIDFMKYFVARDFESLYGTFKDLEVDKEQYRVIIEEMYSRYSRLSDESKRALEVAVILHDIGAKYDVRNMMHSFAGEKEAEVILKELGCSLEFIQQVKTIVLNHPLYSNLGSDYLPKDLRSFTEEQKDMLMLMSIFDMSGRAEGNRAPPEKIRNIMDLRKVGVDKFLEARNFYEYRLGGFLLPVLFATMKERQDNFKSIYDVLQKREAITGSFIENWNDLIKCYAFNIFEGLGKKSSEQFVDLVLTINSLVDKYKSQYKVNDVIVDTDIDFMGLPYNEQQPYIEYLSLLIQQGKFPISDSIKDGVLSIAIKLSDGGSRTMVGGIDFRTMPLVNQAVNNLKISNNLVNHLASENIYQQWQEIEKMVSVGIIPSGERIKEYVQASSVQNVLDVNKNKVINCISNVLRLEEERYCRTQDTLRDILVVLEFKK